MLGKLKFTNMLILLVMLIFAGISILSVDTEANAHVHAYNNSEDHLSYASGDQVPTYSIGVWGVDYTFLKSLCDYAGVAMTTNGFIQVIGKYFLPLKIHYVGLWIGWEEHANTETTDVWYQKWVDDWLRACDIYGIANLFYIRQWGGPVRWWDQDVLTAHPELRSFDMQGNPILTLRTGQTPFLIDKLSLNAQLKEDLKQLYDYYGNHSSWIGFGGFHGDYGHYAAEGTETKNMSFALSTMRNFFNAPYYRIDVDENGFHLDDGTKCKLWEAFKEGKNTPLIALSSGEWQESESLDVYGGTENNGHAVFQKFKVDKNLNGFKILWYGAKVGAPNNLVIELYEDSDDSPKELGNPIETVIVSSDNVTSTKGWQGPIEFTSTLKKIDTFYWLAFSSPNGSSTNKYTVFRRIYNDDESNCKYSSNGYINSLQKAGSVIIWVKDTNNNDVKIYPYQHAIVTLTNTILIQKFTPKSGIVFDTVFVYRTDRWFDDTGPLVVRIKDSDGNELANGTYNQADSRGTYWWAPIKLNKKVFAEAEKEYTLQIDKTPDGSLIWQLMKIETDPEWMDFGGYKPGQHILFKLGLMNFEAIRNWGYSAGTTGSDPITDTKWAAIRFKPTKNGTLSSVDILVYSYSGTPANLKLALRNDLDGSGRIPTASDLEVKTTSPVTGWITTSGWTTDLIANRYYWIVISMAQPAAGDYRVTYTTTPWQYKVLYTEDSGENWIINFPTSPCEVIFKISTTSEEFKVEPESQGGVFCTRDKWVAQSFISPANVTVRGVLVYCMKPIGEDSELFFEIREDNGIDEPSSTILTMGKLSMNEYGHRSMQCIEFESVRMLEAQKKYWLVIRGVSDSRSVVMGSFYREPEDSYGGTNLHTKTSTNIGATWDLAEGREGDMVFSIVTLNDSYVTRELAEDIMEHHSFRISDEPLHGWNSYLNLQTTLLLRELCVWFEECTNRNWIALDVNNYAMIEEVKGEDYLIDYDFGILGGAPYQPSNTNICEDVLKKVRYLLHKGGFGLYPWGNLGTIGDNSGGITPSQIAMYYRMTVPQLARFISIFHISPIKMANDTQQAPSISYGEILERMRYYGNFYGHEKDAIKVLWIGNPGEYISPLKLTPALSITYEHSPQDYNLTSYGNFSEFNVVLWNPSSQFSPSTNTIERIKNFVLNGGGFVSIAGFPDWANEIVGIDYTDQSVSPGELVYANYQHPIIKPYIDISGYRYKWRTRRIVAYDPSPATKIVYDTNDIPWITEHTYGSGRGVFCGIVELEYPPTDRLEGGDRLKTFSGAYPVLLTNSIFYAAKKENTIPAWWYSNYSTESFPWHSELWYSINGRPGRPILLWLSNNYETTNFEIHLNASFYGINPLGWLAVDVQNWEVVAKGSGTDIKINTTIPALSWKPIYIVNATSNLQGLYSNTFILSQTIGNNNATYTIQGPYNQTSWLITNSTEKPTSVLVNNTGALPEHTIYALNASDTLNGWYYDSSNQLLYIKFKTTSTVLVKVEQPQPPVSLVSLTVQVKDASTNAPIFKALIYLENDTWTSATKTTDAYGLTSFTGVQTGIYTIVGSSEGYLSREETVTLTGNTTYTLLLIRESSADGATPSTILASALIPLVIAAIIAIVVSARLIQNRRRESKI